jgi:hypothetical protein
MVWLITFATFLGTVVVLLMFFFFFQREQIRAALKERRIERRIPAKGDLELFSFDEPPIYDKALIENASRHGARVVAKKPWRPNDLLLVRLPQCDSPSRARIAYCSSLRGAAFAIGLQFPSVVDMSDVEPSSHPYRK